MTLSCLCVTLGRHCADKLQTTVSMSNVTDEDWSTNEGVADKGERGGGYGFKTHVNLCIFNLCQEVKGHPLEHKGETARVTISKKTGQGEHEKIAYGKQEVTKKGQ